MKDKEILRYATVSVKCKNVGDGTGIIYFPEEEERYLYILTAKHCLRGEEFDNNFQIEDILIDKILDPSTQTFSSYQLSAEDKVIEGSSEEDIAVLKLSRSAVFKAGTPILHYKVINELENPAPCVFRGYSDYNIDIEEDTEFKVDFVEFQKGSVAHFYVSSPTPLETLYRKAESLLKGVSGSGLFVVIKDSLYLLGIITDYREKDSFLCARVSAINRILADNEFATIPVVKPEENIQVIDTFQKIGEHNVNIARRVADKIANVNIKRDLSTPRGMLIKNKMLVLHGKAGTGKSVAAKSIAKDLEKNSGFSLITLTGEQLSSQYLTSALSDAGFLVGLDEIINSPLLGKNVLIWIESFEKLMEGGSKAAFTELLSYLEKFRNLYLMVTLRDFVLQDFKIFYFDIVPSKDIYFRIAEFNKTEMDSILSSVPEISQLLANPALSELLKNPYYLDKATRIYPHLGNIKDLDLVKFKKLMWRYVIEDGEPERGEVFYKIAIKRANEMSLFTSIDGDIKTIQSLVKDNVLIEEDDELGNRYAPSHDILEDWALIRMVKTEYRSVSVPRELLSKLGSSPPIKRAFRFWIEDLYSETPSEADSFVKTILFDDEVGLTWKEELVVSVLRASEAESFLNLLKRQLLYNNGALLRKFVQLLQTCCKGINEDRFDFDNLVPIGGGWNAMINFFQDNRVEILELGNFEGLILSVTLNWSKSLPEFNPETLPQCSRNAGLILLDMLGKYQSYFPNRVSRKTETGIQFEILKTILKLTPVIKDEIGKLLKVAINPSDEDKGPWENTGMLLQVRNFMINGLESDQICKFFPDMVMDLARKEWAEIPPYRHPESISWQIKEVKGQDYWGLNKNLEDRYDLPSAYQTFFYWMILHHPFKAITFLEEFVNAAFENNQQREPSKKGEQRSINLMLEDNISRTYFCSQDYWSMFRGHRISNNIVQSILMALEKRLLEIGKSQLSTDRDILLELFAKLIKQSNSVAVLAVISSVIQAYPELLNQTTLPIFGEKIFYIWDGDRYSEDLTNKRVYNTNPVFARERHIANQWPHRVSYYRGMIGFLPDYTFFTRTFNRQLFNIIDGFLSDVTDKDIVWKKTLIDMDSRKYDFRPVDRLGYENYIQYGPVYDGEVKKMVESASENTETRSLSKALWAKSAYDDNSLDRKDYGQWVENYRYFTEEDRKEGFMNSSGSLACVGLRDFGDTLTKEEVSWCVSVLFKIGNEILEKHNERYSIGFGKLLFDKEAVLTGLPLVFKRELSSDVEESAKRLIVSILFSQLQYEDKAIVVKGCSLYLWDMQPYFAEQCWNALLTDFSAQIGGLSDPEEEIQFSERFWDDDSSVFETEDSMLERRTRLIEDVLKGVTEKVDISKLRLDERTRQDLDNCVNFISFKTENVVQHDFIRFVFNLFLDYVASSPNSYDELMESSNVFKRFYANMLLSQNDAKAKEIFLSVLSGMIVKEGEPANDHVQEFSYSIIKEIIGAADSRKKEAGLIVHFWALWEELRTWLINKKILKPFPLFMLDTGWTDNSSDWAPLEGKKAMYKEFILNYGFNMINSTLKLLSGVGFTKFMPEAVSWIAHLLKSENAHRADSILLEKFVYRAFFNFGSNIKTSQKIMGDFFEILDFLVADGSAKGYIIREELIKFKHYQSI